MFQNNPMLYYCSYIVGFQPALTQTTIKERECLERYARQKKVLVEIGVWHGVNTRLFRKVMNESGRLYAIDPFPKGRFKISWEKMIAKREANAVDKGWVHFLEMFSDEAAAQFDSIEKVAIDFLFVDGDHSFEAVKKDWQSWSPKMAIGGTIALHDSRSHEGRNIENMGSARFAREVIASYPHFRTIETCDSLTVVERVSR
jgi:predicted O-methyltransferase YrrM